MIWMETTANVIGHSKYDLKGNIEQAVYEWQGPKNGVASISMYSLEESSKMREVGDIITIGPYRLKVFEIGFTDYYCVRIDSFAANLRAIIYRLTRWLDRIYRRLIITAAVWGLADYHGAQQVPSWQDLHIVKRFIK